jgi:hypothetical protein
MTLTARSGPATLFVVNGEREPDMHTLRPSQVRPERADDLLELVTKHLDECRDVTPRSELAELFRTGDIDALPERLHYWVPSDSHLGMAYEVHGGWRKPTEQAPEGYVEAGHYGYGCPAHDARRECWHLYAWLAGVLRDYGHMLPYGGRVPEPAVPVRLAPPPVGPPAGDTRPTGTDAGFYD